MDFKQAHQPSVPCKLTFTKPSLTHQCFSHECNINNLLKNYQKTGLITHLNKYQGQYTDNMPVNYHEAMNQIISADEAFNSLPSEIRSKFQNDPGQFLEFAMDPKNKTEMAELGLINKPDPAHEVPPDPEPKPPKKTKEET